MESAKLLKTCKIENSVACVGRMQQKGDRNLSEAFEQSLSFDILLEGLCRRNTAYIADIGI